MVNIIYIKLEIKCYVTKIILHSFNVKTNLIIHLGGQTNNLLIKMQVIRQYKNNQQYLKLQKDVSYLACFSF